MDLPGSIMAKEKSTNCIEKVKRVSLFLPPPTPLPLYLSLSLPSHNVLIIEKTKTKLFCQFILSVLLLWGLMLTKSIQDRPDLDLNHFSTITSFESYHVNSLSVAICKLEIQLCLA